MALASCVALSRCKGVTCLNTFHRAQTQAVSHGQNRRDDRLVSAISVQMLDEAAIDLDRIDRQVLQGTQARIAGAEVIDLDRDTFRPQFL